MNPDPIADLIQHIRRPDLSVLGNSIRSLPPTQWQEHMLFSNAADKELRQHTGGSFPATLRKEKTTHPVFVLRVGPTGHLVCPCSSRGRRNQWRYIAEGCRLEMTTHVMDRDSFLIEQYRFTVPLDHRFQHPLRLFGKVPASCLRDERTKR